LILITDLKRLGLVRAWKQCGIGDISYKLAVFRGIYMEIGGVPPCIQAWGLVYMQK